MRFNKEGCSSSSLDKEVVDWTFSEMSGNRATPVLFNFYYTTFPFLQKLVNNQAKWEKKSSENIRKMHLLLKIICNKAVNSHTCNICDLVLHMVVPGCWAGLGSLPAQAPLLSWGCRGCVSQPLVPDPAAHPELPFAAEASGCSRPAPQAPSRERKPPGL